MTGAFLNYCQTKKLRPKTLASYEQAIKLFARWLEEEKNISQIKDITESLVLAYILDLQERGKYTYCADIASQMTNYPSHRRDYRQAASNTTINNYIRNLKVFFKWLLESEYIQPYFSIALQCCFHPAAP